MESWNDLVKRHVWERERINSKTNQERKTGRERKGVERSGKEGGKNKPERKKGKGRQGDTEKRERKK